MRNNYLKNELSDLSELSVSRMSESNKSNKTNKTNKNSQKFSPAIKYEEITNFPLRKLLQSEKQPVKKENLSNFPDEWTAIEDHKNKVWEEEKKEAKLRDKLKKNKTKETYLSQMKEKERLKQENQTMDFNYHRTLLHNLDKEDKEEFKKSQLVQEKVNYVKEMQDEQMKDNVNRKKNEFMTNRDFDNKLIKNILDQNEQAKKEELKRREAAQESLKQMLRENDEFKKRQQEELRKEREQDIKFMDEYTKILEKQEQERVDYFKKCESRQMEFMNRMAETVVKQQDDKFKEEEEKRRKHQMDKNKKDQEEEDRRKQYIRDSKMNMRSFLNNQMVQKKEKNQIEKEIEADQLKMWNEENQKYFQQEQDTNQRVKQMNKLYADFLKSQFKNKKSHVDKMSEEEYRINKDILDEVYYTPNLSKKNFLI